VASLRPVRMGRFNPDAHDRWTRAAAILGHTDAAALAAMPDEHLEALIDQAQATLTDGPEPVAKPD
jgi:hypothetical protein